MEILNNTNFTFAYIPGRVKYPAYSLTVVIKGTFDLVHGKPVVLSDEQLYPTGDEPYPDDDEGTGSPRYESDFSFYKPRADLMLVGKCHAPGGTPVRLLNASFQVGDKTKSVKVFGKRAWVGTTKQMTDPAPFTEMDLRYENAYGGKDFTRNPVGKGHRPVETNGKSEWWLPNIEDLRYPIRSTTTEQPPAGFAPLGRMWNDRFKKLGTYDEKWEKTRWPWFPGDFEWSYFNAAPNDMQYNGFLRGDEKLQFINLHPEQPHYKSQLPGIRPRCFIKKSTDEKNASGVFNEIPLNLDTLWVDIENEKVILVWRGVTDVVSDELEDVREFFIADEKITEPQKTKDEYEEEYAALLKSQDEGFEIEEPEDSDVEEEPSDIEAEAAAAEAEIMQHLKNAGVDVDKIMVESENSDTGMYDALIKKYGLEDEEEEPAYTRERVEAEAAKGNSLSGAGLSNLDLSGLKLINIDLTFADLTGVSLKGSDLSGADLSEAVLQEADLSDAILKNCTLKGADCNGVILNRADLTEAVLDEMILTGASMQGVKCDNISAIDADFSGSDLSNASFDSSTLNGAEFSNCILNKAIFNGSQLIEASVEGAHGHGIDMTGADITKLRASNTADFTGGTFRNCTGTESIWEDAILRKTDFRGGKFEGALFTNADFENADLSYAWFRFARFTKANLKGTNLLYSDIFHGTFEKARIIETDLRGANLFGSEFLDAVFERFRIEGANFKMTKIHKKE